MWVFPSWIPEAASSCPNWDLRPGITICVLLGACAEELSPRRKQTRLEEEAEISVFLLFMVTLGLKILSIQFKLNKK